MGQPASRELACISWKTARSSMTRRALKSVRGNVSGATISVLVRSPSIFCMPGGRSRCEQLDAPPRLRANLGGRLDPQQKLVHRGFAGDHDAMLAAVAGDLVEHGVDLARIDVLAADREHVVDAPEDALRQARIGASAGLRPVVPQREIAGREPDHRLRGALEMRVDRRAALAVGHTPHRRRIADLGVDDVLPAAACRRVSARAGDVHEWRHLGHRAAIEHLRAEGSSMRSRTPGIEAPGSPEKNMTLQAELARVEPFLRAVSARCSA